MSRWGRVLPAEELRPNEARLWPLSRDGKNRPREAIVVLGSDGAPRAYLNRCQHLPIPLDGGSRQVLDPARRHLSCGTHGALYRFDDGLCVEGPCTGTSLERVPVRVEDGWVEVEDVPEPPGP